MYCIGLMYVHVVPVNWIITAMAEPLDTLKFMAAQWLQDNNNNYSNSGNI